MIRINLLPEVKRKVPKKKVKVARQIPYTWIIAGLAAVLLAGTASLLMHLRMVEKLNDKQQQAVQMQEEIKRYKIQEGLVEKARAQRNALTTKLEIIASLKQRQTGPVRLLDELAAAMPPKVWLSEMAETGAAMTINGYAVDNRQIAQFMENLAKRQVFSNVELVSSRIDAAQDKKRDNMPVKTFQLTCHVDLTKDIKKE
jgi:type IV pilus assembly protein PilN